MNDSRYAINTAEMVGVGALMLGSLELIRFLLALVFHCRAKKSE